MFNRQRDYETGEDMHIITGSLNFTKDNLRTESQITSNNNRSFSQIAYEISNKENKFEEKINLTNYSTSYNTREVCVLSTPTTFRICSVTI